MRVQIGMLVGAALCLQGCDLVPGTTEFRARSAVSRAMIDPSAARVEISRKNAQAVCGAVNGKNRMGAYAGATPFIWEKATGAVRIYERAERSDYALLRSVASDPKQFEEMYLKLDRGCEFPEKWGELCLPGTVFDIDQDKEFCAAWRADDKAALGVMARY